MAFQILGSDKIIKLNDFLCLGQVQNVDWNPNLQTEEVFELGRDTRIAASQELETTGSFEILSIGGTAGVLSRMLVRRDPVTKAFEGYKYKEELDSGTATSGTTTTLTDTGATWTINAFTGYYVYITAGSASGESRRISSNTATQLTVAPAFTVAIDATSVYSISGGPNAYTITQADLTEAVFDLIMNEKSDQVNFDRSVVLPRMFLTSIAGRAEAGGNASETFNFTGDWVSVAPTPYHDVRSIPATWTSSTTATLVDTAVASTTHALAYFYIDERRLTDDNTQTIYATLGAAGLITVTGMTIPATARLQAIVWDNTTPTTTFPTVTERQTPEFFVRGYMASLFIAPTDSGNPVADEQWLRVQSIDWNIDLRVEALSQIAYSDTGTSVYCRVPTLPFSITANVSAYESDWRDWQQMFDPAVKPFGATGTDWAGETYDFAPVSFQEDFAIVVRYYTKAGVLMQDWIFGDMKPETLGARVSAGGRAEITWSFRGTACQVRGYNL